MSGDDLTEAFPFSITCQSNSQWSAGTHNSTSCVDPRSTCNRKLSCVDCTSLNTIPEEIPSSALSSQEAWTEYLTGLTEQKRTEVRVAVFRGTICIWCQSNIFGKCASVRGGTSRLFSYSEAGAAFQPEFYDKFAKDPNSLCHDAVAQAANKSESDDKSAAKAHSTLLYEMDMCAAAGVVFELSAAPRALPAMLFYAHLVLAVITTLAILS
eukprot:g76181.t1